MDLQDILKTFKPKKLGLKVLSKDELHDVQEILEIMLHDFDEVIC